MRAATYLSAILWLAIAAAFVLPDMLTGEPLPACLQTHSQDVCAYHLR